MQSYWERLSPCKSVQLRPCYGIQAPAAKEWLGIEPEADNQNGKPHLDLEDYLNGLIQMSNELVCHNSLLALFLSMTALCHMSR